MPLGKLVADGYPVASVDYRLSTQAKFPAQIHDIKAAIRFLRGHGSELHISTKKMVIAGDSAGAHLAALVATDERRLAAAGKGLDILKGVIPLDTGVYDGTKMIADERAQATFKRIFSDDVAVWRDASPYHHVIAGKKFPPFLICYSRGTGVAGEREMRVEQANLFANALQKSGHQPKSSTRATSRAGRSISQRMICRLAPNFSAALRTSLVSISETALARNRCGSICGPPPSPELGAKRRRCRLDVNEWPPIRPELRPNQRLMRPATHIVPAGKEIFSRSGSPCHERLERSSVLEDCSIPARSQNQQRQATQNSMPESPP